MPELVQFITKLGFYHFAMRNALDVISERLYITPVNVPCCGMMPAVRFEAGVWGWGRHRN